MLEFKNIVSKRQVEREEDKHPLDKSFEVNTMAEPLALNTKLPDSSPLELSLGTLNRTKQKILMVLR